jgi:cytochrome c oxidase subunit 2
VNIPLNPPQASNFAGSHDFIFWLITILLLVFTVAVSGLCIFFAVRYRVGSKANRKGIVHDSKVVEYAWTIPPIILGLIVFAFGAFHFLEARNPPKDAMEVYVIGKRWMWHLQHPNGVREMNELHVPLGKPVKLTMISQDVIHAFYIPAFRVQYMVVPGKYSTLWFTPTQKGKYPLFCNMYCGTDHSEMGGYVYVMEPEEYNKWLKNGGDTKGPAVGSLVEQGKALYDKLGCGSQNCHAIRDNDNAPSLYGIAGTKRPIRNGGSAIANDDYLRESIVAKDRKITAGYADTMPSYANLSEEEIRNLVEYIKSLGKYEGEAPTPSNPGANGNSTNGERL